MVNLKRLIREVLLSISVARLPYRHSADKEKHFSPKLEKPFQSSCMGWFYYSLQIHFNQCGKFLFTFFPRCRQPAWRNEKSASPSSLLSICNLFIIKLARLTRPKIKASSGFVLGLMQKVIYGVIR